MPVRWSCRFLDAVVGSESFATIAVSSTKVLITVFCDVDRSDRKGPRMLPWGTPECIGCNVEVSVLNLIL